MSSQSLKEQTTKRSSIGEKFHAKLSNGNQVFPTLTETNEEQIPYSQLTFGVDETKSPWAEAGASEEHHGSIASILPRKRRRFLSASNMMRILIAAALILSVANLFLTVALTRREEKGCTCQKDSAKEFSGKNYKLAQEIFV